MKKLFKYFAISFLFVLLLGVSNVSAQGPKLEMEQGASIRAAEGEIEQGLRFTATLNESADEHGFYLLYGDAAIYDLENAIDNDMTFNGKEVYRVVVNGVNDKNQYRVVLTGVPEKGYLDNISVVAFYKDGNEEVFVDNPVTRSVGEVALKLANQGNDAGANVITYLEENVKRAGFSVFGQVEITGNMYETNHFLLKEEFIKDWNEKFGTSWIELNATTFFNNAKIGITDAQGSNTDISNSNIYKFFNDANYGPKWEFVLNIMTGVHPMRQVDAIKGDGINASGLWHTTHLSYSIANFFNQKNDSGGWDPVNFSNLESYKELEIVGVYVDLKNYNFFNFGDEIGIIHPGDKEGYEFKHYKIGEETYLVGSTYQVTEDDVVFELVYEAIEYEVKFYDGETELTNLAFSYTTEEEINLPNYTKEDYLFEGWYNNPNLEENSVNKIDKGSIGEKRFYAKMLASETSSDISYYLDGGYFSKYESREEMITLFMNDYHRITGRTQGPEEFNVSTDPIVNGFVNDPEFLAEWEWLKDYLIQVSEDTNHPGTAGLKNVTGNIWRWTIHAFLNKAGALTINTVDYRIPENANGWWVSTLLDVQEVYVHGQEVILMIPVKEGYTFGGWYDNSEFAGELITKIEETDTGEKTFYANWIKN